MVCSYDLTIERYKHFDETAKVDTSSWVPLSFRSGWIYKKPLHSFSITTAREPKKGSTHLSNTLRSFRFSTWNFNRYYSISWAHHHGILFLLIKARLLLILMRKGKFISLFSLDLFGGNILFAILPRNLMS